MKATISAMKALKYSRNWSMLALSGSIAGMTRNIANMAMVMSGIRNTPQNLDMVPLTWSFVPQWEAIESGSWFQSSRPARVEAIIRMLTIIMVVRVDIFTPCDVSGETFAFDISIYYKCTFLAFAV